MIKILIILILIAFPTYFEVCKANADGTTDWQRWIYQQEQSIQAQILIEHVMNFNNAKAQCKDSLADFQYRWHMLGATKELLPYLNDTIKKVTDYQRALVIISREQYDKKYDEGRWKEYNELNIIINDLTNLHKLIQDKP